MDNSPRPFECTDENSLRADSPNGVLRSFPKGAVLVNEGDRTDALYILVSGRLKAYLGDDEGKEVVLNMIEAGDYFGELVLDGGPRSASVMAVQPSRVFIVPREDFETLIERNPRFVRHMMHQMIARVRTLTEKVRDLTLSDVYGRLAKFIEGHAIEKDGQRVVPERLTQHDIAARIGGSREMVSRILKELGAGGYITVDAKHVIVHRKLPARW